MKILKKGFLFVSLAALSLGVWNGINANEVQNSKVVICDSPNAKKYHTSSSCRGLNNCKHQIVTVSKIEAQNRGLGCCGWCCK